MKTYKSYKTYKRKVELGVMLANPFRPSFGVNPVVFVGRMQFLRNFEFALKEGVGSPHRFTLIQGIHGTGKTALLNQMEQKAKEAGWHVVRARASESMVEHLVQGQLPKILNTIHPQTVDRSITNINVGGIGGLGVSVQQRFPEGHTLWTSLNEVSRILTESGRGLLITMDELQAAHPKDLHELSDAIQDSVRDGYNIALSFAGLPGEIIRLLEHPGTTFLRRATPITLGEITDEDVSYALDSTAKQGEKHFTTDALRLATGYCHGYAFLIQLIGSIAWTMTTGDEITEAEVDDCLPLVIERMGEMVHKPALRNIPFRELDFLCTLAAMGESARTSDIGEAMGISGSQPSTYRRRLIDRGLLTAKSHGEVTFAMPYLREHINQNLHLYQG